MDKIKANEFENKITEERNKIIENVPIEEIEIGKEIEKEHEPTVRKIQEYLSINGKLPPNEWIYDWISLDHINEHKQYYNKEKGLPNMEKQLELGEGKKEETVVEPNKMEAKEIIVNGKKYIGLSNGKQVYFNEIDAQELGINEIEIKADNENIEETTKEQEEEKLWDIVMNGFADDTETYFEYGTDKAIDIIYPSKHEELSKEKYPAYAYLLYTDEQGFKHVEAVSSEKEKKSVVEYLQGKTID